MALVLECPWNVESLEDFLYYCCPECDEKSQSRDGFLCHALAYHPSSNNYLMPLEVKQEVEEKFISSTDVETDLKHSSANNFKVKEENIIQDEVDIIEDDEEYFPENSHENYEIYGLKQETDNSYEFRCNQCDKIFRSNSGLDYHLNFFHGEGVGDEYVNNENIVGEDPKPFKCNLCKWKGRKKKFLDKHINRVHEGLKDFKCDSCDRSFTCSTRLRRHNEKIHEKIFTCDFCGKCLDSKQNLEVHINEFHDEFKCDKCAKCFKNKFKLAVHIKNKHTKLKYKCDYDSCEKSFSSMADLKDHREAEHKDDAKKFSCQFCQKSFNVKRYLDDHIRITHEGNRFDCDECGKSFAHLKTLTTHIKAIHEGIKDYVCDFDGCIRAFTTSTALSKHIARLHEGLKDHICERCGKGFFDKWLMITHMKSCYSDKAKYKCDFDGCEESFEKMGLLRQHKNALHKGKEKYKCDQCSSGYNNRRFLQDHIERIHEGKKQMCYLCGKQMANKASLRIHIKTHENDPVYDDTIKFHPDSEFEDVSRHKNKKSKIWGYMLWNEKENKTKCQICGYIWTFTSPRFISSGSMIDHLKNKHKVVVEPLKKFLDPERNRCEFCKYIYL